MYIGIDIGGTTIKGVLTKRDGDILSFKKIPIGKTPPEIENCLIELIRGLAASRGLDPAAVKAIGVGSAGSIDRNRGMVLTSPNIPALQRFPLIKTIERRTGVRAFLENDATVAVIGEWWKGAGRKYTNWIMLTLGTGIGGGVVIDNRVYTGQSGSAMEVGHTSIDYRGRKCPCGGTGCLELYASATGLMRYARSVIGKSPGSSLAARMKTAKLDPRMIEEEALRGDALSLHIYEQVSIWLGIGIANLVNIFNPEAIVFGGGLSRAHRLMFPVIKKTVHGRVMEGLDQNVKYLIIRDQEKAPALGAARMAMDALNK
ncbi:MAG: ROK family protein [Spirochaetota bacterium]